MATVALFDQEVYIDIQRAYDTIVGRLQQQNLLKTQPSRSETCYYVVEASAVGSCRVCLENRCLPL